jgi:hypothetical protein
MGGCRCLVVVTSRYSEVVIVVVVPIMSMPM